MYYRRPFTLISYMPRFGQQAYFVSFPSKFLGARGGGGDKDAVMAFSANFACKTGGCKPNIEGPVQPRTTLSRPALCLLPLLNAIGDTTPRYRCAKRT